MSMEDLFNKLGQNVALDALKELTCALIHKYGVNGRIEISPDEFRASMQLAVFPEDEPGNLLVLRVMPKEEAKMRARARKAADGEADA